VFTRPADLGDDDVRRALHAGWGLDVSLVEHAPVGFGSHHWSAVADGTGWFVTVDDLVARRLTRDEPASAALERLHAALATARALHDEGMPFVVAPVPTRAGGVLHPIGERWAVSLFPLVEGGTHTWGPYRTDAERAAVVALLARLHEAPASCRALARVDDLTVPRLEALLALVERLSGDRTPWDGGPYAEPTRRLLTARSDTVRALAARHRALASAQRSRPDRFVLTHGEPHRANTLDTAAGVVLVDWDTVLLAPPERDLWRLVGEDAGVAGTYRELTGIRLEGEALDLYALAWDLADLASFAADLRRPHVDDDDTRTAWAGLRAVLEGGTS